MGEDAAAGTDHLMIIWLGHHNDHEARACSAMRPHRSQPDQPHNPGTCNRPGAKANRSSTSHAVSLTLSGILGLPRSAAQGSPGLRPGYLALVEVVLEGSRPTERGCFLGRWQSAEALDVDGDGGQDVLDVGLSLSSVAATAHTVAVGELVDRALHSGAHRVAGLPLGRLLLGADAELQVAEFSWGKADGAGAFAGGGALGTGRAGLALTLGEPGHDQRGRGG